MEIVPGWRAPRGEALLFADAFAAEVFLRRLRLDASVIAALRAALRQDLEGAAGDPWSDEELLPRLARAIASGRLRVVEAPLPPLVAVDDREEDLPRASPLPRLPPEEKRRWEAEVVLVLPPRWETEVGLEEPPRWECEVDLEPPPRWECGVELVAPARGAETSEEP